ncbi:MAG: prepilin-type N-terminal cleavage/methylation domain-containing protein [Candidatus Eremiobacteraeota bacterium]|nr:prepilin-type N-terminal cleavage/methylation domain-containing protein [Candidatus Eremiobacteraeota bacterium]
MKIRHLKKNRGFSLLEVIIALAIALLMLTALLSLEIKASRLAAETIKGFDALPTAIEEIEELTLREFAGRSEKKVNNYLVVTSAKEITKEIDMVRLSVEVYSNDDQLCSELSLYKFKF